MSQREVSQRLALDGGTLVLLGMPPGTVFGIDVNFWNVGEKFRGVKMIPPGLHFIYFSAVSVQGDTAPRTGFFHFFHPKEVLVKHYDPQAEDLKEEEASVDEVERIRSNLRELDQFLGPYPLETWKKWISLTQHVEEALIRRLVPLSGRVCSVPELIPVAGFKSSKTHRHTHHHTTTTTTTTTTSSTTTQPSTTTTQPSTSLNTTPDTTPHPLDTTTPPTDTHTTPHTTTTTTEPHTSHNTPEHSENTTENTTETPPEPATTPDNTAPPSRPPRGFNLPESNLPEMKQREGTMFRFTEPPTKGYRDGACPSEVTKYSLDSSYTLKFMIERVERAESLLGELQVAFVVFLVGESWEGWEKWRSLVEQLCKAEEVVVEQPQLYLKLLSVLHYQVNEIPPDLFVDIVESNNFLASALSCLFANIEDNTASLPPPLVLKAHRFKQHLTAKFGWDLTLGDDGEYAPVVVT